MSRLILCTSFIFVCFFAGCGQRCEIVLDENKQLNEKNTNLQRKLDALQGKNTQLKSQLATLTGLDANVDITNIISVENIKLAERTGFFDKDYNGSNETLIVYLKTIDKYADAIKGSGSVEVEIWDLSLEGEVAKLKEWKISPWELKDKWASSMMTNYYRLVFDVTELTDVDTRDITLKVRFTDYLTGKVFERQKVIKSVLNPTSYQIYRKPVG